jgi:teichuronic acid biosynthesis protein TuaE
LSQPRLSLDQWIYFLAIALLGLGGLGGSLQPSRLLSICLLPFLLVNLRSRLQEAGGTLDRATLLLAGSLALLATLSIGWSYAPITSAGYTVVLCVNMLPLLYIASLSAHRRAQLIPLTLLGWGLCLAFTLPVAFYELSTGQHFAFSIDGRGGGEISPLVPFASVFFGNFNDYSLFLTLCITLVLALSAADSRRFRPVFIAAVVLAFAVLVFNSSRGALGAAVVVLLIRLVATLGAWRMLACLAVAVAAFTALFDIEDSPLLILVAFKFTDVSDDLTNDDGRLAIIKACLQAISESYGLGLGADAYPEYLTRYFPNIIPNPHNLILELTLNFSVAGLIAFAAHAIILLRRFFSMFSAKAINGTAFALGIAPLLLLPLLGVVQSHLTGYTYFWYWYSGLILLSNIRAPRPRSA